MKMQGKGWPAELARVFLWLLLPTVVAALQLPPDIQADRYLVRAQRQIEEQDFAGAKQSLERILELESQHGLQIPEEFFFRYAEVLGRLDLYDEAIETATKYLTLTGRDGEHYIEALELLDENEQAKAAAEAAAEAARRRAEEARRRAEARRRQLAADVEQISQQLAVLQRRGASEVSGTYAGRWKRWDGALRTTPLPVEVETRSSLAFSRDCQLRVDAAHFAWSKGIEIRGNANNIPTRDEELLRYQVDVRVSDEPIVDVVGSTSRYRDISYGFVRVSFSRAVVKRLDGDGGSSMSRSMRIPVWLGRRDGRALQEAVETFGLIRDVCAKR